MSGSISKDYVSIINKQGSGYNIPQIVDAIVNSEIDSSKTLLSTQKAKVEASISGMASLKASISLSQNNFSALSSSEDYLLTSSDTSAVSLTVANRSKVGSFDHKITDIITAKPKTMSVSGWDTPTHNYSRSSLAVSVNGGTPVTVDTAGGNATTITAQLNAITGLNASLIKVTDGDYRMLISGLPGQDFSITASGSDSNKMNTSGHSSNTVVEEVGASLKIDGVTVNRASNTITDLFNGVSFTLVADKSSETRVSSSKSSANIQKTVKSFISELNKYKADLDSLGFVDLFGNEDGVLANDFYLRNVKQQFTNFIKAPISGYGDEDVYLIELGIKTARGGSFVFDKTIFDRTFTNNPEKFDALAHDTAYASDPNISVVYSSSSNLNPGKYSYENSTQNLISSATSSSVGSLAHSGSGPFTFTSSTYPGFAFLSSDNDPPDFDIYLGRSAKTRLIDLFKSTLAISGSYSPTVDLYNDKSKQLDSKLADLEQREKILQARYTAQFAVMEELVTTSKSTGSYISQLVDGWNSKK